MNDEQIDGLLSGPSEMPEALAAKIRAQIQRDTQPVQPLKSALFYAVIFSAVFAAVSGAFAAILRLKGLHALSSTAAAELLLLLALSALGAAYTVARAMRPASGRLYSWLLAAFALLAYEALVLRLFRDYSTPEFLHSGLVCLSLGTLCGALTSLPLWYVVRRGFIVQPALAGAAIGLLGGLSGLTFLTLHCDNLTVPHTALWHAGVLAVCTTAGALAATSVHKNR